MTSEVNCELCEVPMDLWNFNGDEYGHCKNCKKMVIIEKDHVDILYGTSNYIEGKIKIMNNEKWVEIDKGTFKKSLPNIKSYQIYEYLIFIVDVANKGQMKFHPTPNPARFHIDKNYDHYNSLNEDSEIICYFII